LSEALIQTVRELTRAVRGLRFADPVRYVYNPLEYAGAAHEAYLSGYARAGCQAILLGMNPGPFGMAQTGVPFGEVQSVRDWLKIETEVGHPPREHPKRPILGFACPRREVSGARLWGWARERFGTPARFFSNYFVANYCPLVFLEDSGRNRTPDRLPAAERTRLFAACDRALRRTVEHLRPKMVVGVGKFAERRARAVLADHDLAVGGILHPSPASPAANRGWAKTISGQLAGLGLAV
jgi:single-strand selective monofunctional uracil DNA glycosylase